MNKRNSLRKIIGCGLMALTITACNDTWDAHYTVDPSVGSNVDETLWDLIAADSSLTEFASQLKKVGYDTLLSQNRYYTVWAPMNGFLTIAANDGILENDSLMELELLQNHIADYSHVGTGVLEDNKVTMLNKKLVEFIGSNNTYTFKNIPIVSLNQPAKNGILHCIGGEGQYATFAPNIWEYLDKDERITEFRNYIKSFTEQKIDEEESVIGPLQDGQVTYLMKVMKEENKWWKHIGEFLNEDSSYTVIVPTNEAWNEMYEVAKSYYVMDKRSEATRDSIQRATAYQVMASHLAFSNTMQVDEGRDSLISNYAPLLGDQRYPLKNPVVFRYEEKDRLFEDEIDCINLSNGTIHIVNKLNYSPIKCWHDTITTMASFLDIEEIENETELKKATYGVQTFSYVDSVTKKSVNFDYLNVQALRTTDIKATFNITGVLSAKYRIKLVIVPAICQYSPEMISRFPIEFWDEQLVPTKFTAKLYYPDDNKGTKKNIAMGTYVRKGLDYTAMDTIVLDPSVDEANNIYGDGQYAFTFPSCEATLDSETPSVTTLEIKTKVSSSEYKDGVYGRTLRINSIILEPVE